MKHQNSTSEQHNKKINLLQAFFKKKYNNWDVDTFGGNHYHQDMVQLQIQFNNLATCKSTYGGIPDPYIDKNSMLALKFG